MVKILSLAAVLLIPFSGHSQELGSTQSHKNEGPAVVEVNLSIDKFRSRNHRAFGDARLEDLDESSCYYHSRRDWNSVSKKYDNALVIIARIKTRAMKNAISISQFFRGDFELSASGALGVDESRSTGPLKYEDGQFVAHSEPYPPLINGVYQILRIKASPELTIIDGLSFSEKSFPTSKEKSDLYFECIAVGA